MHFFDHRLTKDLFQGPPTLAWQWSARVRRAWLLPHGATKTAEVPAGGRLSGRSVLVVDQDEDEDDDASGMF